MLLIAITCLTSEYNDLIEVYFWNVGKRHKWKTHIRKLIGMMVNRHNNHIYLKHQRSDKPNIRGNRWTDRQMDICNSRVTFVTEKLSILKLMHLCLHLHLFLFYLQFQWLMAWKRKYLLWLTSYKKFSYMMQDELLECFIDWFVSHSCNYKAYLWSISTFEDSLGVLPSGWY